MISIIALGLIIAFAFRLAWNNRGQTEGRIYAALGVLFSVRLAGEVIQWIK